MVIGRWLQPLLNRFGRLKRRRELGLTQGPFKIMVGAADIRQPGWLCTDRDLLDLLEPSSWDRLFSINSLTAIQAEHVWEHLDETDGVRAAATCFGYLRPGGHLRVAVPDGYHPDPDYIEHVRPGGNGAGADDHRVLYTHESFRAIFEQAGFDVRLLEFFNQRGQFHRRSWSSNDGHIRRSADHDPRNQDGQLVYTSLILDAIKPASRQSRAA